MQNKGLLFIPDISGFTRFVGETEIEHSRLIIQELLEVLIDSNDIGLEISEIEGDAILFYKFGDPPNLDTLYKQVEKMFTIFHQNLIAYSSRRYCQCKACRAASNLSLKVITHYGEFADYNVRNYKKLIGRDIIIAHQLLKNEIEQHEYWLVTKNLAKDGPLKGFTSWMEWNTSAKLTETGEVPFHYAQLSQLRNDLPQQSVAPFDFSNKSKVVSASKEYETDIITLFHAVGDFKYRHQWKDGIAKVEELNHFLPRVGMRCKCTLEKGGEEIILASSYTFTPERIEFSETEEKNQVHTYYSMEVLGEKKTRLTLDFYIPENTISTAFFNMLKKRKIESGFRKSLENLNAVAQEIKLPPLEMP